MMLDNNYLFVSVGLPCVAMAVFKGLTFVATWPLIWQGDHIPWPFRLSSDKLLPSVRVLKDSELTWKHHLYVTFNRAIIAPIYGYHLFSYLWNDNTLDWTYYPSNNFSISSLIIYSILFFIQFLLLLSIYDFFYYLFHRWMHLPSIYPYIHKHHHSHISPFRGTYDGADTHPFEMIVGIYLHFGSLFALKFLFINILNIDYISGLAFMLFHTFAGFFNSLNHTRFGISIPFLYDSRDHDIHHRIPNANYATSLMLWDKLFGTYKEYYTPRTRKDGSKKAN